MAIEKVLVRIYSNNTTEVKTERGKIIGGRVLFKSADPTKPVIFLNQPGYSIQDLQHKKRILFYDSTRKMLIKPSSIGGTEGTIDDMSIAVQQTLAAENDTAKELGVQESNMRLAWMGFAIFIIAMIISMLTLYLVSSHVSASSSNTNPAQATSGLIGAGVISSHLNISTSSTPSSSGKGTVVIT